jgi:hypothetical protein
MPLSTKKFVIVSSQVNNYGYRYDTAGMDISQYKKNPVLLYMHERGKVIGHMQNVTLESNGDITGYPFFSDNNPFAMEKYHQVEEGSLRMCSSGVQPFEISDDPELLFPGQTLATVVTSKLKEASIVDIGADDNALALYFKGQVLQLSDIGDTDISHIIPSINNSKNTEMKEHLIPMLLLVGLSKDGTVEQLMQKVTDLKSKADDATNKLAERDGTIVTLNDTIGTLQQAAKDAEIDTVVNGAADARKITEEQKPMYKQMGKIDLPGLKKLFDTMAVVPTLQSHVGTGTDANDPLLKLSYKEAHTTGKLAEIKTKYPEQYKTIFKTHFGKEPTV